jgi:group I intron endonuclease
MSEESRKKMSESKKGLRTGEQHHYFGKPLPEKTREAARVFNTGRPSWNAGKKMSEDICNKNRDSKIKKPVLQYDLNGNFINEYQSISEAARVIGKSKGGIQYVCSKDKAYAGFFWRYKIKQEKPEFESG